MTARAPARSLAGPLGLSALLHAAAVTGLLVLKAPAAPPAPPMYKVELVAAPAGPRAVGVVGADPGTEAPPPPKAAVTETEATVGLRKTRAEARTPRRATPNVTPTPRKATGAPPRAGGGKLLPVCRNRLYAL